MEGIGYIRNSLRRIGCVFSVAGGASAIVLLCCANNFDGNADPFRDPQITVLFALAGWLAYFALSKPLTKPLAAFASYALIMWAVRSQSMFGLAHILCMSCAALAALWLGTRRELPAVLSWVGAGEAAFGLFQWAGWNPFGYKEVWELHKPAGTFGQETILGAFLVAALAPALFTRRPVPAVLILACCMATGSSMTVGAAGVVFLLWLWKEFGAILPGIITGVLIVAIGIKFDPGNAWFDPNGRVAFWQIGLDYLRQRPLFGFGPGTWWEMSPELNGIKLTHLHNEWLEFLVEYGIAGGLIMNWALVDFIRKFKFTWHHALVVGVLVNALGNFPLHIASIGTIFLTAWLLSVRERLVMVK